MSNKSSSVATTICLAALCLADLCLAALPVAPTAETERTWVEPQKPAPLHSQRPTWPSDHPILCSDRRPLCVHGQNAADAERLKSALDSLENAHARVVDVLRWRPPLPDGNFGPSEGFDTYLSNRGPLWISKPDPIADAASYARASSFAVVDVTSLGTCQFEFAAAAALARAGIYGIDAAANDELANATASYVASIAAPCPSSFVSIVDDFQVHPNLAVSNPAHDDGRGALLFPWFIQETLGRGGPVDLLQALWVLSVQPAPEDPGVLLNEPDFVDAVGIVATDHRRPLSDLWLDFAVARAFVGDRDDGVHLPSSRFLGAAGSVRFDWSVEYKSLPRRLAPIHPVEPTGASYLWLSLEGVKQNAGLGFRANWEAPDVFRFALVIVDDKGQAVLRHDPVSPQRGTSVESNVELLTGGAGVLVVACNTGSILRDIAFDPDNHPYTPRSFTVSLFPQ